jgi:hypothetical protein
LSATQELEPLTLDLLALRVRTEAGLGFRALLVSDGALADSVSGALAEELRGFVGLDVVHIVDPSGPRAIDFTVQQTDASSVVIIRGLGEFGESDWRHLDLLRSRLLRQGPLIFLLDSTAAEALVRWAPNLASWLGDSVFALVVEGVGHLSDAERESRIRDLEQQTGFTSREILERARIGTLPADPVFAEWLVLLKSPDLLGH